MSTYLNPGTVLPVPYAVAVEGYHEGIDERGPFVRPQYYIQNWSDVDNFVNALRGIVTVTGGSGGTLTRRGPHQWPLSTNLFCTNASPIQGVGAPILNPGGFPSYSQGALVSCEYRAIVPYDYTQYPGQEQQGIDPATPLLWCTQELDFSSERVTVQGSQITYQSGTFAGQAIQGATYSIRVPLTHMVLTFQKLPYFPTAVIRSLQGRVNNATFLGAATGTVLFAGARVTRDWNTDGSVVQKLQMEFLQRTGTSQLWNNAVDPSGAWVPVAGSGGALYTLASFAPLTVF